ncbi:hypothetical protein B566_EDAN000737 [Ephemera danica]|nr:hypothetical protein B566_EDAN000737 [Ephemera danica]
METLMKELNTNDCEMSATDLELQAPETKTGETDKEPHAGCMRRAWEVARPDVLCPRPSRVQHAVLLLIAPLVLLLSVVSLVGPPALPPSGPIFQMLLLFVMAAAVGQLVSLVRLPPLLGMLLTGILLRNVGAFYMEGGYLQAVSSLRLCAMVVILSKAGLGLNAAALRKLSCAVLRLALGPCGVEAATSACAARLLLGMPWLWAALLGCILAAVSPAVVVPALLGLKERGYGEDKGISTLVIAASSIDDIAAISAFGIFLGIIFAEGSLTRQILQGPLEVIIGLTYGLCYGFMLIYVPHAKASMAASWRALLVAAGGVMAVLGSQSIGFDGAGPLGCITAAFVAACGWRAQDSTSTAPVEETFSQLWLLFQPVLFGLIGTEIVISELDRSTVVLGLCVLLCGLTLRIVAVGLVTMGGFLSLKEQLFVTIAWLPKATVQAALAPVALDIARQTGASEEVIELAEQVLTVAVLSILVTAPIGAIGISVSGPRLLNASRP